jgi:ubiquitin carboxyl-terminal hydrolase 25/28
LDDREKNPDKYDNFKEIHTFICSAPNCPAVVDVRISPPRLKKEQLSAVWNPAKVYKRGHKAIQDQPERYQDQRPQHPAEVLFLLRTYLSDALSKAPTEKRRINDRNKKFLLAFSDECDDLFEYLDFQVEFEDNPEGVS